MAEGATAQVAPKPEPVKAKEKEKVKTPEKKAEYTEESINRMNGTQLRKLATKNGVENPEEFTVKELKSVLCGLLVK